MRTRLMLAGACAALVAVFGLNAVAGASESATTAAKKISKKKAKKQAKRYLQSSAWINVTASPTGSSSSTTTITFCANGTYTYRRDSSSVVAASQTTWDGQWHVASASPKRSSARVTYTVQNFRSVYFDGSPTGETPPPSPNTLNAFADSEHVAFFDGLEFNRNAASC